MQKEVERGLWSLILLLSANPCLAKPGSPIECCLGDTWGVGRLTIPRTGAMTRETWLGANWDLRDAESRVLHTVAWPLPGADSPTVVYRGSSPTDPRRIEILFRFVGEKPLEISMTSVGIESQWEVPRRHPARARHLERQWWRGFLAAHGGHPGTEARFADGVVCESLAHRLGLPLPEARPREQDSFPGPLELLLQRSSQAGGAARSLFRNDISLSSVQGFRDSLDPGNVTPQSTRPAADPSWSSGDPEATPRGNEPHDLPLPERPTTDIPTSDRPRIEPAEPMLVDPAEGLVMERLASLVPHDCLYLRFTRFSDLLSGLDESTRELQRWIALLTLDPVQQDVGDRIREQWAVRELPFARMVADQLAGDAAIIGLDTWLESGPALGLIIEPKNAGLTWALQSVRKQVRLENPGATLRDVTVGGKSVSLLTSPDHRVRSFFVELDGAILISNSRALVERCLTSRPSGHVLGRDPAFQSMRSEFAPTDESMVLFIPTALQRNLWRQDWWIEGQRRQRAHQYRIATWIASRLAQQEIVALAASEPTGDELQTPKPRLDVAQLKAMRYLPPHWPNDLPSDPTNAPPTPTPPTSATPTPAPQTPAPQAPAPQAPASGGRQPPVSHTPDSAITNATPEDILRDPERGIWGSFIPIPDGEIAEPLPGEIEAHAAFAGFMENHWGDPAPIFVRISQGVPDGDATAATEFRVRVAPLKPLQHRLLRRVLGAPSHETVLPEAGWDVALEFAPARTLLPLGRDCHMVFAIPSGPPIPPPSNQLLDRLLAFRMVPWVLASTPADSHPWLYSLRQRFLPAEADGYACGPFGLWRRTIGDWHAISFHRPALEEVTSGLAFRPAEDEAQARLSIADPRGGILEHWLPAIWEDRVRRLDRAATRLAYQSACDLAIEVEEREFLEKLVWDGKLADSRGTMLDADRAGPASPTWRPLDAFRGLSASLRLHPDSLELIVRIAE